MPCESATVLLSPTKHQVYCESRFLSSGKGLPWSIKEDGFLHILFLNAFAMVVLPELGKKCCVHAK